MAACTTPLDDGMRIETHPPEIEALRRTLLKLIARTYPAAAVERDPDGNAFHGCLRQYGLEDELRGRPDPPSETTRIPTSGSTCRGASHCSRCVRICDELQGQFVWRVWNRGDRRAIRPDGHDPARELVRELRRVRRHLPDRRARGPQLRRAGRADRLDPHDVPVLRHGLRDEVGTRDGRIVTVRPVDGAPVNKGHLCVKGRYAFGFVTATDRVDRADDSP